MEVFIGHVKRDLHIAERNIDAKYLALDQPANLRILLSDYHALLLRRFNGDTAASDILIDLAKAVELARLTERQSEALRLVYEMDLTQEEAGRAMGIGRINKLTAKGATKSERRRYSILRKAIA